MKHGFKRTTAAILAALILASAGTSVAVFSGVGSSVVYAAGENDTTTEIVNGLPAAGEDGTITLENKTYQLTDDIAVSNAIVVSDGTTAILDLNGHKITEADDYDYDYYSYLIGIASGGKLTIRDSSANHTGSIGDPDENTFGIIASGTLVVDGGTISGTDACIYINNGGTLTLNNGTITNDWYGIDIHEGSATINGGTVSGEDAGVYVENASALTVTNGEITGDDYGIKLDGGTANISGGTVYGANTGIWLNGNDEDYEISVSVSGGTVTGKYYGIYIAGNSAKLGDDDKTPYNSSVIISDQAVVSCNSTWNETDGGAVGCAIAILGKGASLTVNGGSIEGTNYGIAGNGSPNCFGTEIKITDGTVKASAGTGIYHPQVGTMTISGGEITGGTGVEIRSGEMTVSGNAVITGTDIPSASGPNGSGTTSSGMGIAVVQHTTEQPITVNIEGGTISGYTALNESNEQGNPEEAISNVTINIKDGDFTAANGGTTAVSSQNKSSFITGGTFSTAPENKYVSDKQATIGITTSNGTTYYVGTQDEVQEAIENASGITAVTVEKVPATTSSPGEEEPFALKKLPAGTQVTNNTNNTVTANGITVPVANTGETTGDNQVTIPGGGGGTVVTPPVEPEKPAVEQVQNVKAVKKATSWLKLNFDKVEGADGYEIYNAETNEKLADCTTQNGRAVLTKTVTGLEKGTTYKLQVRAYKLVEGQRVYGKFSEVYTKATAHLDKVTGVKPIKKTQTTLKIQFNKVEGAERYKIFDAETGKMICTVSTQSGADVLKKTITGLKAGETRKYKVRAYATINGKSEYGEFSNTLVKATAE